MCCYVFVYNVFVAVLCVQGPRGRCRSSEPSRLESSYNMCLQAAYLQMVQSLCTQKSRMSLQTIYVELIQSSCTDSLVVKDPILDAGGPRFESHAGRVTGKPTPSLWRDKHPAIKGLRPPEHHAGKFRQDQKTPPSQKNKNTKNN